MFLGSGNSVVPLPTLQYYTGSRNSRCRSSKPEVTIFQLVEELATRLQIIIPRYRGRAIQWRHFMLTCVRVEMSTSALAAAILDLSRLVVGIALLSCLQVEIWVIPDWWLPPWIYHFRLGRTVLLGITVGLLDPENIGCNCIAIICTITISPWRSRYSIY